MTTPADLIAVKRAHAERGPDAALAEIRRRWPVIPERDIARALESILATAVEPPAPLARVAQRDAVGLVRKNRGADDYGLARGNRRDPPGLCGRWFGGGYGGGPAAVAVHR